MENQVRQHTNYKVRPYEDEYWGHGDDQSVFTDHCIFALGVRLEFIANCLGTFLTEDPAIYTSKKPIGHYIAKWSSRNERIDFRVAVEWSNAFLQVLKDQIADHTCKKAGLAVPTKLFWWTSRHDPTTHWDPRMHGLRRYDAVDSIIRLEGFPKRVFKKVMVAFAFE